MKYGVAIVASGLVIGLIANAMRPEIQPFAALISFTLFITGIALAIAASKWFDSE